MSFRAERSVVKNLENIQVYVSVYAIEILPPYGRLNDKMVYYYIKKISGHVFYTHPLILFFIAVIILLQQLLRTEFLQKLPCGASQ